MWRRQTRSFGRAFAVALVLPLAACTPAWRGPVSDHFDGKRFHSIEPMPAGLGRVLKRAATRDFGPWPDFVPASPAPRPPARVAGGGMRVTLVNHATVLLQVDGVNILTDPTWARRDIPWLGSWRRRPPGLLFEELPQIDVVLVSHDHHDHMDLPTLRRLRAGFQPRIFCGLGNASYLARHRIPGARDLDWWESAEVAPGVTVTAVPARHLSGRGMFDQNRTLWCGFVVEGPSGAAYFAGDTGPGSHFAQIRERFPALRLALLPIGASEPAWYMRPKHMGPRDVLPAARDLGAATIVPIHFGTFPQGDEGMSSPAQGLRAAIAEAPEPRPRIVILENGQSLEVPEVSAEAASPRAANAAPASLRARSGRD